MNVELNEDQVAIRDSVREFAQGEVAPRAAEIDRSGEFPKDLVAKCAEMGFLGVAVPESLGGSGLDTVSYALIIEELSAACATTGVIVSVNNSLCCDPISTWGTDEVKSKYLPELASGKKLVNGSKNWITNGVAADVSVVLATTDTSAGHAGVIALVVERDWMGFDVGPHDDKLGIRGSGSCQFFFDDCRVPVGNRLGGEHDGFKVAMRTLDAGRIGIAAQAVGIGRAAHEAALAYSKERKTFGKPIAQHQAIQFMLADMATELDAARLLTWPPRPPTAPRRSPCRSSAATVT